MKKLRLNFYLLIITSIFFLLACDKDDDPTAPPSSIPQELVGIWTYQSVTINSVPVALGFVLGWHPNTVSARFTVSADESFVYQELDSTGAVTWTESGTFTVSGDSATISITSNENGPVDPPSVLRGVWALIGDELSLTTIFNGATVVFVAIRTR